MYKFKAKVEKIYSDSENLNNQEIKEKLNELLYILKTMLKEKKMGWGLFKDIEKEIKSFCKNYESHQRKEIKDFLEWLFEKTRSLEDDLFFASAGAAGIYRENMRKAVKKKKADKKAEKKALKKAEIKDKNKQNENI